MKIKMNQQNITYTLAKTDNQLKQILEIQKNNLARNIDQKTIESQGFVTAVHDFALLKEMNKEQGHSIALVSDKVVGYALSMTTNFSSRLPVLVPMFKKINGLTYQGKSMNDIKFFIMGQVCIVPKYRGTGVFNGLYQQLKIQFESSYDCIITEIDQRNKRSIAAHKKVGFKLLHSYCAKEGAQNKEIDWDLVIWSWS